MKFLKTFWKRSHSKAMPDAVGKELQQFERQVGRMLKISRTFQEKDFGVKDQRLLKRKLLSKIKSLPVEERYPESIDRLAQAIRTTAAQIQLSLRDRTILKEKIFQAVEDGDAFQHSGVLSRFLRLPKSLKFILTSALLLCFVATSLFYMPFQVPAIVMAAHTTYIQEAYGQVFIYRNGKTFVAKNDFSLEEGDVIETKDKSFVTIRFFDDSTSRLGQNTKLEVKRLYNEPFQDISTQVEVLLGEGRVWTRVLNLVDDHSSFTVDTDQASITATKKAAFDIQAHSTGSTLSVFDNVVDFVPKITAETQLFTPQIPGTQTRPVVAGFQANFSPENSKAVVISPLAQDDSVQSDSHLWVQSNLERDKAHAEDVMNETENHLAANTDLNDTSSSNHQTVSNDDDKPFSDPLFEVQRQSFLGNYHALLLGETFLIRNQGIQGMQLILQFRNAVRTFMIHYPSLVADDPVNAAVLHGMVEKRIAQQEKDLATFLPGDPLYPVKEVLEETELFLSPNDIDVASVRLSQSERKLLEIQDLVNKGNMDMANRVLTRYQSQIDGIVLQLGSDHLNQFQDKLSTIFGQQLEQIKVLTALEKSLSDPDRNDFLLTIRKIRHTILDKLVSGLELMPDAVPQKLVLELQDLLKTYLQENVRDEEFVTKMNRLLLRYGADTSVFSALKFPEKIGIVTIIEDQATESVDSLPN
jgi:hypothetical protein